MTRRPVDDDLALARRLRPVNDLDLWRSASPEATDGDVRTPRPKARAAMEGAGQRARREARPGRKRVEETYALLAQTLEAYGPSTRKELASYTALPVNTVNARISEMRNFEYHHALYPMLVVTEGRRNGESICHLSRLRAP